MLAIRTTYLWQEALCGNLFCLAFGRAAAAAVRLALNFCNPEPKHSVAVTVGVMVIVGMLVVV